MIESVKYFYILSGVIICVGTVPIFVAFIPRQVIAASCWTEPLNIYVEEQFPEFTLVPKLVWH